MLSFHSRKSSIIEIVLAQSHPQLLTHERWSLSRTKHLLSLDDKSTMNHIYNCIIALRFIIIYSGFTHYSKSQIFVQKFSFDQTPTFSRVFRPNFFWQFFSWNQSCQQLESPKPQHFHEFFTPQKIRQFSREIKVEFLGKNLTFRIVCKS